MFIVTIDISPTSPLDISICTMSSADPRAAGASSTTRTRRTGRIRPSGSSSKDGISWECSNLLHFDDICRELDEEEEMDGIEELHNSSSSSLALPPRAFASDGTLSRVSSVDTFRSRVIEKHTSSGSLTRVTSMSTNASNGSSLRSYLSFSSGPDAAAGPGPTRRLAAGTTSNANFDSQANNNNQQRQRNAAASSAGRSMLGRN